MAGLENATISQLDLQANITSQSTSQWDLIRTFTLSCNFLFGPPTHIYIIWLIFSGGRFLSDFLHLNLSVCEVIISLTSPLNWLKEVFPQLSLWLRFSVGLIITARPLFQCMICVERYLAVVHPVTFLKYKPLRYRVMCCASAWIISFCACLFTRFTIVAHGKVYVFGLLFQFLFFLFVNLYCSLAVLRALKQPGPGERGREREKEDNMKRRAFQRILITTITVLILFVPTIIVGCIFVFLRLDVSNVTPASFSCLILAGFVQPVLYLYGNTEIFCRKCSFQIPK